MSMDASEYPTPSGLDDIKTLVRLRSDNYVLKPQREGGGNNVYGEVRLLVGYAEGGVVRGGGIDVVYRYRTGEEVIDV